MIRMTGLLMMALTLCVTVNGQGMGKGISKYTRGQSDPRTCLAFFEEYLNAEEMPDDCTPRGRCTCATQGRGYLGAVDMFGVHTINCSYHPYGEYSLKDIEDKVAEEVNDFKDGYNQHLDSHVGVYVSDLRSTVDKFEKDGVPFYGMMWYDGDRRENTSYYSVITAACSGYFIEYLSDKATGIEKSKFHEIDEVRFDFADFDRPERNFHPIKVSRATTKIEEMIDFYTKVFKGKLLKNGTTADGVEYAWVQLDSAPNMAIHFINRPAPKDAKFSVKDLEDYVNGVHDEYVKSPSCGFDQFADHHWAYDEMSRTETLSSVAKKCEAGGHKYRWFYIDQIQVTQIYAFDPSGWSFQLDGTPGNDVPRRLATYDAACKSNDGCYGQGLCNEEENVFTPF